MIEAVFKEELNGFPGRLRHGRTAGAVKGYRHGSRDRQVIGTFGAETISVPHARIEDGAGKVSEWRSKALPRDQRLTKTAEALIASVHLAGTNTRRVVRPDRGPRWGRVSRSNRAVCAVQAGCQQSRGQPRLAQGEGGLGRVVRP